MEKKRIMSVIMAVLMALSLLPSTVFAAAAGEMSGKLRIKGFAAVGSVLQAEYGKAEPQGITNDDVSFKWSREISDTELEEVSTEKKYTVKEEDLGYKLVLEVTGREDLGLTGSLTAETPEVALTEEEAKALVEQLTAEGEKLDMVPAESAAVADAELEDTQVYEETYAEDGSLEFGENEEPDNQAPESGESEDVADAELDVTVSEEMNMGGELEENMETGFEEEPVCSAEAVTEDGTGVVDFGTVKAGEEEKAARSVTIKNTGNQTLHFQEITPEHFMVADVKDALEPGAEISLWIQPREEMEGSFDDTITYTTDEGVSVSYQARAVVVPAEEEPIQTPENETPEEKPVYTIATDMDAVIFGSLKEGYEEVSESQTVTVSNTGETAVTLKMPETAEYVDVIPVLAEGAAMTVAGGESLTFRVQPKLGLAAGSYSETLKFGIEEDENVVKELVATVSVDAAEAEVTKVIAEPSDVVFEDLTAGYESVNTKEVTLLNQGTTDVVVKQPLAEYFDLGAVSAEELPAGGSVSFAVQPVPGLEAGTYSEVIQIFRAGETEELLTAVKVSVTVKEEEPVYKLTVKPEYLDFGELELGYGEAPASQKITVINEGNAAVTLEKPEADSFRIGSLSRYVLEPGEKAAFAVRPKDGLEESTYIETIEIPNDAGLDLFVQAEFSVTMNAVALTGIQKPKDIVGLANGIEKSANAFGLPSSVVIQTTDGKMKAKVNWNVEECDYNPKSKEAQTFKVSGKVVLPEEVANPDKISRNISVKVSVKAAYVPKVPDASENKITGISSEGYTTQSKISFKAVGAGMENTSPREGDVRFLPLKWKVINVNKWNDAPYSATFGITKAGTYTLSVLFDRQKFDGEEWVNTGEQDTKQVQFSISQAKEVTPTPSAQQKNADKKSAVETGDTTPILPFVIILAAAVACIAGVVIYRKKK